MLKVELEPDLEHCIETVGKTEYAVLLNLVLGSAQVNKELEQRFEVVQLFLKTADFRMRWSPMFGQELL